MTTLEKLNEELETAKLNVKLAQASTVIVKAFLNRDEFSFPTFDGEKRELFGSKLFSCFQLSISLRSVKSFEKGHLLFMDIKAMNTKELKSALKLIEANETAASTILSNIANELIK